MSIGPEIVFESEEHFELYCHLFPEKKGLARLASELLLIQTKNTIESEQKRLEQLALFLNIENKKELKKYLATLEQLRLSLIVTHEQVDFCFSHLFPSPKNLLLQRLLHLYLDSPLKQDLAQAYWIAIGKLKEKQVESLNCERIFVKAKSSTFLFSEWAEAHQYLQETSSRPIEFWELPEEDSEQIRKTLPPMVGPAAQVLSHLASEIFSHKNNSKQQLIAFGGAPHALLFLESKLSHLKISFNSLFFKKTLETPSAPVIIHPFQSVPFFNHFTYWSYIDESFFAAQQKLFLTEPELFSLMNGGFSIPRITTDRNYLKTMLSHTQGPGRERVFLSSQAPVHEFEKVELLSRLEPACIPKPELTLPPKKLRLSATQLENYSTCPTQYLIRHRLKLRPIQNLEDKYALIFGSAVHGALEAHFREPDKKLLELFKLSLSSLSSELEPSHPLHTMMVQQFSQIESHFFELENTLKSEFGYLENLGVEKSFELELEGFTFMGKIDRIIEREDGSTLLLDYKTGTVDFSPNHINEGHHFQALLYILSIKKIGNKPCAGVLFYDLKKGELRRGILNDPFISKELKSQLTRGHVLTSEKFDELLSVGTQHLTQISQSIQEGQFTATPNATECSRCESPTFCRGGMGYV